MPCSEPRETHLHLGVVGRHAKAHQAEGHQLLLVDVHVGPGVVLGEKAMAVGPRRAPVGPALPRTKQESPAQWANKVALTLCKERERPMTPHLPREPG